MIKYLTKEEAKKRKLQRVECKYCGKMLLEANGVISKICPGCKKHNYIEITAGRASQE